MVSIKSIILYSLLCIAHLGSQKSQGTSSLEELEKIIALLDIFGWSQAAREAALPGLDHEFLCTQLAIIAQEEYAEKKHAEIAGHIEHEHEHDEHEHEEFYPLEDDLDEDNLNEQKNGADGRLGRLRRAIYIKHALCRRALKIVAMRLGSVAGLSQCLSGKVG